MSWDYYNKEGVRLKGTSNGYFTLIVIDDLDKNEAAIDFFKEDAESLREIGNAFLQAAKDLSEDGRD